MAVLALAEAGAALGTPPGSRPPTRPRTCWWTRARRRRPRCAVVARRGRRGPPPACWRTTRFLAEALLALHQATGDGAAARAGRASCSTVTLAHFADPADRGRSSTPRTTPRRCCTGPGRSPTTPRPSGAAALAGALLTASVLVDDPQRYRAPAEAALRSAGTLARALPAVRRALADGRRGRGAGARCRSRWSGGEPERGGAGRARARDRARAGPWSSRGDAGRPGRAAARPPPARSTARAAAYVCRGFVCDRPVTTPEELTAALLLARSRRESPRPRESPRSPARVATLRGSCRVGRSPGQSLVGMRIRRANVATRGFAGGERGGVAGAVAV